MNFLSLFSVLWNYSFKTLSNYSPSCFYYLLLKPCISIVCMYVCIYVCMYVCIYEFPDDNKQEILELKVFNIFSVYL